MVFPWMAAATLAAPLIGSLFSKGGRQKEKREYIPNQTPGQQEIQGLAEQAAMGPGASGALGTSADYYRGLLDPNSQAYQDFANPALRQYGEEIVPGISEQFAGMGAGGLSSSGFRNAQTQGAVDLAERLGQIRANLQMAGAQGLQGIHNAAMQPAGQYQTTQQGSPGFWGDLGETTGNIYSQFAPQAAKDIYKWGSDKWGSPGGTQTGVNSPPTGGYQTGWNLKTPASPSVG